MPTIWPGLLCGEYPDHFLVRHNGNPAALSAATSFPLVCNIVHPPTPSVALLLGALFCQLSWTYLSSYRSGRGVSGSQT